jgi:hypothetical protein
MRELMLKAKSAGWVTRSVSPNSTLRNGATIARLNNEKTADNNTKRMLRNASPLYGLRYLKILERLLIR